MKFSKLEYIIALSLIDGIGPILSKKLISYFKNVEEIFNLRNNFEKVPGISKNLGNKIRNNIANNKIWEKTEKIINFCEKNNIKIITFEDKNYPYRLKNCDDSPLVLFAQTSEKFDFNSGFFIGIVGTRNPTIYGKNFCNLLIKEIYESKIPITIVSGFAYGIDITAHKKAIEYNLPTITVLPVGFDNIYPSLHKKYVKEIIKNGGIVSEFCLGVEIEKGIFIRRNRIIAGLCDGIIVIESKIDGGAMSTANFAFNYNREVFALPGKTIDTYSEGPNYLIKTQKAQLIESFQDICNAFGWKKNKTLDNLPLTPSIEDLSDKEKEIINIIKQHTKIDIDSLALLLDTPVHKLSPLLLELEFKGIIKQLPGNIFQLTIKI